MAVGKASSGKFEIGHGGKFGIPRRDPLLDGVPEWNRTTNLPLGGSNYEFFEDLKTKGFSGILIVKFGLCSNFAPNSISQK